MSNLLDSISQPADVKLLSKDQLVQLCQELRDYLIEVVLKSGGHFSGNLGVVELTVVLHHLLDFENDTLIWDVGHQSYPHKILSGRKEGLKTIRQKNGISGFPNIFESPYDSFGTGHSSTSISASLGLAVAANLQRREGRHVSVIGDGSLTGGMAWEALNNAAVSNLPMTIIINDNDIGIDPNPGAIGHYLTDLMMGGKSGNLFEDWGFSYYNVPNGHSVSGLKETLEEAFSENGPNVVHIKTKKGKGFKPAEEEQTKWHAVKYVKVAKQGSEENSSRNTEKFQETFGIKLLELALRHPKIVAITPAMPSGSSLNFMMDKLPERVFDVGIAEQHAVTFSGGLAQGGLKPFCTIYSSFFQRAFDQYVHDICLQNLNVTFFLDRAGIVGSDGATHHGLYDIAFLRGLPNTVICAPLDSDELRLMMDFAVDYDQSPLVIRYPRGRSSIHNFAETAIELGKGRVLFEGKKIAILSIGAIGDQAIRAHALLQEQGIEIGLYDMRFAAPLDQKLLTQITQQYGTIITIENGIIQGGFGSAVMESLNRQSAHTQVLNWGFPSTSIGHAEPSELFEEYGLDAKSIFEKVKALHV
jgi:1-deoxy-D-xylulose-5-phosphate synthase